MINNGNNNLNKYTNSRYNNVPGENIYDEGEIDLIQLMGMVLLNKWTFTGIVAGFTILAVVISLMLTPIYQSTGSMLVTESKNRYSYAGSDLGNLLTTTYGIGMGSTIANELQVLQSRKLSKEIAQRVSDIEFDENGRKFPILWRAYPVDSTTTSMDTVAMRYRNTITFSQPDKNADIISVTYESPLATESAAIINLTMDTYSSLSTNQNREMAVSALAFLNDEKERIENQLLSSEDLLQDFMNRTNLISVDPQASELISTLSQISVEQQKVEVSLVAVNAGIDQYEKQLEEIKPGLANQYSEALGPIIERYQYALAELETERLLYITKNPAIMADNPDLARLDKEILKIKSQIKDRSEALVNTGSNLYLSFMTRGDGTVTQRIAEISESLLALKVEQTQYETQKQVLNQRYQEVNKRFEALPDDIIALARLKRDVRISEEMYFQVSSQQAETSLWEKTQFGLGRPLDYAEPALIPIKPRKKLIVLFGIILGGAVGFGYIFLKERLDNSITSVNDINKFDTSILGAIPDFKIINDIDPTEKQIIDGREISNQLITLYDHISPISEAYRRLRINIMYANPDKRYKVIMISSASKGEGKSTLAANLAVTFTGSDKRVLIIDLDLRRPTQHKIFGENREPGLTDYLFGMATKKQVVRQTVVPNVDLISVGRKTPEPASILDSMRLKHIIEEFKEEYDHVILDTAPYGIISDSASLQRLVDGIVVVSRFKVTTKRELEFTMDGLGRLNAEVIGVVLNAFNPKKSTDYYTNYSYYQRTYAEYYKDQD